MLRNKSSHVRTLIEQNEQKTKKTKKKKTKIERVESQKVKIEEEVKVQWTELRQQIKIHISHKTDKQTESIEDTLSSHKDQIEKKVENIAACVTIMSDKIQKTKCFCEHILYISINSNAQNGLKNMQRKQTMDKAEKKQ